MSDRRSTQARWEPLGRIAFGLARDAEGENGKKITLDNAGEFFKFTVDPDVVTVAIEGFKVCFNHLFDVADAAGRIHERIDAKARTGDLDALWKLPYRYG